MKSSVKWISFLLLILVSIVFVSSCDQLIENPKTYAITYHLNGATGGSAPADQTKKHDQDLTLATNSGDLVRTGYTFGGWNTKADGSGIDYAVGATYSTNADTTLHAKWVAHEYDITYHIDGGANHTANPATYTIETPTITLKDATKDGYTFKGWYDAASGGDEATQISSGSTGDVDLYARWEIKTYTISYSANEATGGGIPAEQTKTHGVDLDLATNTGSLVRTGYTFAGWNTKADGRGTDYAEGVTYTINADTTLYVKWRLPEVGDLGPAGGYIFYDQGEYINGWRYLEAAPEGWSGEEEDPKYIFGYYRTDNSGGEYISEVGTQTGIGTGKYNTENLVATIGDYAHYLNSGDAKGIYAAKVALDYSVEVDDIVYDDWFLPSIDESDKIYKNLYLQNLGGFSLYYYWSSSEYYSYAAWCVYIDNGSLSVNPRYETNGRVRPVRRF